jgi:hypothetical protein
MLATRRSPNLALLLLALAIAGCGGKPSPTIDWALTQKDGKVTLTLNPGKPSATTLLFESFSPVNWPADGVRASGTFQVADQERGVAGGTEPVKIDEVSISHAYAKGVATIRVNYCAFKIVDNGAKLEFVNETFPLAGPKTIVVARDSTARMQ